MFLRPNPRKKTENESFFEDLSGNKLEFPSLLEESSVDLSIVIPAFNEYKRLKPMLTEAIDFLSRLNNTWEIILVDDGSTDKTSLLAKEIAKEKKCASLRVLVLEINRGKGGAVTQGVLVSRGKQILFVDADGATQFSNLAALQDKIVGHGIAVGSRAHMVNSEAVRSAIRNFLMYGFHTYLMILGISAIKDTQCGFKLFTREAAQLIFPNLHVEGWIFDIEILLLAEWNQIKTVEVPVNWHEVEGTKLEIVSASIKMALDLLVIRFCYWAGLWNANVKNKDIR